VSRHLLCHLWPKRDTGTWRLTAEMLSRHWAQFDGTKAIAVAVDGDSDPVEVVAEALPRDALILPYVNDPSLREVTSLVPLLRLVVDDPDGRAFYCHGKGCSHPADSVCQSWRDAMEATLLSERRVVDCALKRYPMVGSFRRRQRFGLGGGAGDWHYSGTFFWVRCDALRTRPWYEVDLCWFGAESWPGRHFRLEESFCAFLDNSDDLYNLNYWQSTVTPALARWQDRLRRCA